MVMGVADAAPMTVEELSERTGVTVRNIRAYQAQSLIPAPERSGRSALYGPEHLARLELVRDLREQGFGLQAIERLLQWSEGIAPQELRAFADTLMHGLVEESPLVVEPADAASAWGDQLTPELVARSVATGFLRVEDDGRFVFLSPTLRNHGMELKALGLTFEETIEVLEVLHGRLGDIAEVFARIFVERVGAPAVAAGPDRAAALADLGAALDRMRPLATSAVNAAFRLVLQQRSERALGEILPDDA